MKRHLTLAMGIVLAAFACVVASGAGDTPDATVPRSEEARKAMADYDRAVREAESVFNKKKADAGVARQQALKHALDAALERKNLDEANRIKAEMNEAEPRNDTEQPPFFNTRWHRFGIGDHGECSVVFYPNGRLEGVKTGWTGWKQEGNSLILLKGDKESTRFTARRDITVFITDGALSAKDSLILVPSSYSKAVQPEP